MRKLIGALTFSAVMLGGSAAFAQAQNFGKSGTMVFGAERLFAFYKANVKWEDPDGDNDEDWDHDGLGFGWGANAYPFNEPRLGFDYFVIDQLSVGGALGYAEYDADDRTPYGGGDVEAFILAPRVGYYIGLGNVFGFWPRGGFTYHSADPEGRDNSQSGLALTLEAMFTVSPAEHFSFMFGPTFDMDLRGKTECRFQGRDEDCTLRYRSFGIIQAGVIGWF